MNRLLQSAFVMILFVVVVSGCSKSNDKAPNIDPVTGKHPAGWAAIGGGTHSAAFIAGPSSCYECHGTDLKGGISAVGCFSASRSGMTCHANGPSGHPAGWNAATAHGAHAKAKSTGQDGFVRCQVCHGSDLSGGIVNKTCLNTAGCHGAGIGSPHAAKPWLSNIGASTHADTDTSNAPACAVCHRAGANSTRAPSTPAPAGTAPGCFNNTLCHGVEGHATGWRLPANHGTAAKAAVGGDKGFVACKVCHGANYAGGTSQQSCMNTTGCHGTGVNAPHPGTPWSTHSATNTSNATQCAPCHTNGNNSTRTPQPGEPAGTSGCFNNTLCHGQVGHPVGWAASAVHGAAAKSAPSGNAGFSSCQPCHGTSYNNGAATTCMNNAACHGSGVNAPHARKPWLSHTTTNVGNVGSCAACHTGGANSTLGNVNTTAGTAGCFNNTLCHFHPIPYTVPLLHGAEAKKNLAVCQKCHGTPGTTAFAGATLADGTKTIACQSCHTAAKAHPTDWQGSGAYSHRTALNINVACIICHDVTQGRTAPMAASPSCYRTTFTNGLGQTRTCHANGPGVAPHAVPYNNHNATARANTSYCLGCHQVGSNGGGIPPGCMNCHLTSPVVTPTGCTSCHANPPTGGVYPNVAAAHSSHSAMNVANVCAECHSGLGLGTVDHLNRARARTTAVQANPVVFGTLAKTGGLSPTYTAGTQTCANTYCHGASLAGGSNKAPQWGQVDYQQGCGTCHGYPPATTIHTGKTPTTCIGCHPHVNSTGTGFSDATKHINGDVEATGSHVFPNPGSLHKAAANGTGCRSASCHPTDAAGSTYPVTAGTAPNCRSCHLNNSPTTTPFCSDCHGSSTANSTTSAGRPNSNTFPNRQGSSKGHNKGDHTRTCTTCHPYTSGDSRHGWSNRTKSSNAQIIPALNWSPGTRAAGQGTCNPSAGGLSGCHSSETGWY